MGTIVGHDNSIYDPRQGSVIVDRLNDGKLRKPNEELVKALEWLRNIKNVRDLKRIKELSAGKVDARRLYKAPLTNTIFRETQRKPRQKQNIWMLMDGSGSMSGEPGDSQFGMCAATKAVVGDARIYQYCNRENISIRRVDSSNGMYHLNADGGTPSGEAMLYVSYLLSREKHRGLLIHFTDGDLNTGRLADVVMEKINNEYPNVSLLNVIMGDGYRHYARYDNGNKIRSVEVHKAEEFGSILKAEVAKMWGIGV